MMQTGYQVKAQTESSPTMAIAFADNPKYLQPPNDIFYPNALACQLPIRLLFGFWQPVKFAVLQRQNHIRALSLQAAIAQITAQANLFAESQAAHLYNL